MVWVHMQCRAQEVNGVRSHALQAQDTHNKLLACFTVTIKFSAVFLQKLLVWDYLSKNHASGTICM